jgi:hypothetical protein
MAEKRRSRTKRTSEKPPEEDNERYEPATSDIPDDDRWWLFVAYGVPDLPRDSARYGPWDKKPHMQQIATDSFMLRVFGEDSEPTVVLSMNDCLSAYLATRDQSQAMPRGIDLVVARAQREAAGETV